MAAVLLFWAVGAHNRLVRLRNAIVVRFAPIEAQFRLRHSLLRQLLESLVPVLAHAAPRLDALRAACLQADAAFAHARLRPGTTGAIASLRLAEEILTEARARLPVQTAAGVDLRELNARIGASDTALAFARRQFNEAVLEYNAALRQFPTGLIAGLFSFRGAATF